MLTEFVKLLQDFISCYDFETAAVAQWSRAFALQAEGWMFESQPRKT